MTISQYYLNAYSRSGKIPEGLNALEKINYMSVKSPFKERLEIFSESLNALKNDFGSVETEWGEINRYQRNKWRRFKQFLIDLQNFEGGL